MTQINNDDTKIFALGGLGEVGKNMFCVVHKEEIIIIDAGIAFPQGELLGIDYVIPDFTYLKQNESKIKALFITHGHEDHIGGIPFLLQTVNVPFIYAPNQAIGLINKKLTERNIQHKQIFTYDDKAKINFKHFQLEFFKTTHSIPDSHGISIQTPNGRIVLSGDFKFDFTPIGPMTDLHKIARIGEAGVDLLLSDSTNALHEGISSSESRVDEALGEIFKKYNGRIIIATFASNVYRLKHIIDTCKRNERKVAIFGRSMENNLENSIQSGFIKKEDIFITPDEANLLPDHKVCLLCTGSQGEPLAALSRIANGTHRQIELRERDIVVFSSSAIPGNALSISRTINKLYMRNVQVFTNTSLSDIHTSGHGKQEELKLMIRLLKPTHFMPVHGEFRMQKAHANLAIECGIPKNKTFVLKNGDVLSLNQKKVALTGTVIADNVYIDGTQVGNISNTIMKERKAMSNEGIIIIAANIKNNKLLADPVLSTRGFVLINNSLEFLGELAKIAKTAINQSEKEEDIDNNLTTAVSSHIFEKTGRKPVLVNLINKINS